MLAKLRSVHDRGLDAVRIARAEGVPIVFGTDLLGHMHARQSGEFTLRAAAVPPLELLQSATAVAARLMGQEAHIGALIPGAFADLLIVDGDPAESLEMLTRPGEALRLIMQGGRVVENLH
jgi:imidazolonepropionase-like amidohydrolase